MRATKVERDKGLRASAMWWALKGREQIWLNGSKKKKKKRHGGDRAFKTDPEEGAGDY